MSWVARIRARLSAPSTGAAADSAVLETRVAELQADVARTEAMVRDAVDDLGGRLAALEHRLRAVERSDRED